MPALRRPRVPQRRSSTCIEDDAVPTPPGYAGWERSSVTAWEAVEPQGGIVPDIEEDRAHFPPKWLRYPSPMRSAELLAEEARKPKGGLYTAVPAGDLQTGDILVRIKGGRRVRQDGDRRRPFGRAVGDPGDRGRRQGGRRPRRRGFFDGAKLRPEVLAYRVGVKRDSSMGHVRGLMRTSTTWSGRSSSGRRWSSRRSAARSTIWCTS